MKIIFISFLLVKQLSTDFCLKTNNDMDIFLNIFQNNINNINQNDIVNQLKSFIKKYFNLQDNNIDKAFNICSNKLFEKTDNIYNYIHLFSYSGKVFSDLGLQTECINKGFSYYLLSFNFDISTSEENKIYEFLEKDKSFVGLCLFNECDELITHLFKKNNTFLNKLYNGTIIKIENNNNEKYVGEPYYTLNELGYIDETIIKKEKTKYKLFIFLFIISISFLGIEILISIIINCGYNLFNDYNKTLSKELNIEEEKEEEEDYLEGITDQNIFSNKSSSQEDKKEKKFNILIKFIIKYFSFFTNIILLSVNKNKYYNSKNMRTISKLKFLSLLLMTFTSYFDVLIKTSSKVFDNDSFFKEFYFIFFKFASFGIDIYICLDGFEVMYKLISYIKANYYEKGYKTITFLGILKFYLYSFYKIFSFIILFFIVNYFNRYYIYIHNADEGRSLYYYYSNEIIVKKNVLEIINPKYILFSYFSKGNKNIDNHLFFSKMSLVFIIEFYSFTLFIIIFYIGNIIKSKIYDYTLLLYIIISYFLTYFFCSNNTFGKDLYTYNKITRNILIVKYPHILFNHYLMGALTGLICFYLKESNSNNSIISDKEKCPFIFCLNFVEFFDYLMQKALKIFTFLGLIIQIMISSTFTLSLFLNNKKNNENNLALNFILSFKILYYYESGLFIFIFCFVTILLFSQEKESKNTGHYNIFNLLDRISFSYANTIYLMTYSYYFFFCLELKLTYQNLWLITFGFFIFFSLENLVLTILFILPSKIVFKSLLDRFIIINKSLLHLEEIRYKSSNKVKNMAINNYKNEDDDSD